MGLFRRRVAGRHALGAAVTAIPSAPLRPPVVTPPPVAVAEPELTAEQAEGLVALAPLVAPEVLSEIATLIETGEAWASPETAAPVPLPPVAGLASEFAELFQRPSAGPAAAPEPPPAAPPVEAPLPVLPAEVSAAPSSAAAPPLAVAPSASAPPGPAAVTAPPSAAAAQDLSASSLVVRPLAEPTTPGTPTPVTPAPVAAAPRSTPLVGVPAALPAAAAPTVAPAARPIPVLPPVPAARIAVPTPPVAPSSAPASAAEPSDARSVLESALAELLPQQPKTVLPRVQLGFRDGSSAALDPASSQAQALQELAHSLTRQD